MPDILEAMLGFLKKRTKMVIQVLILLQITETTQSLAVHPGESIVTLASTLKQGALCPGERTATFACTAVGTDLVWLVDWRMMSYNANARVGAIRSNAQSDQTSILMRVESRGDGSGVASRMSVLTISELPSARAPITVRCHNGSTEVGKEIRFWRRQAGILGMPRVDSLKRLGPAGSIQLNWTAPDLDGDLQVIDYYLVQKDDGLPTLVKNSSVVVLAEQGTNHTIKVQAVDGCNQKGRESLTPLSPAVNLTETSPATPTPEPVLPEEVRFAHNGARRGIAAAIIPLVPLAVIMNSVTWR